MQTVADAVTDSCVSRAADLEVVALVNELQPADTCRVTVDASELSSGAYLFQVRTGELMQNRIVMLSGIAGGW
jgi:hypothetical protein